MLKTITASYIKKKMSLSLPTSGRKCYIVIDKVVKIQMVPEESKGAARGIRWYFICPVTGIKCRKLIFINDRYIHRSLIKGYYRKTKPEWYTDEPLTKILVKKQRQIDAEKLLVQKSFKRCYRGKPTKRYLKCLKDIEAGLSYTMTGIVNGFYS